jgi:uncharacterized protein (DUF2384 family)
VAQLTRDAGRAALADARDVPPAQEARRWPSATVPVAVAWHSTRVAVEDAMPVAVRDKLEAITRDLGSQAAVAKLLGVSRSRVSRWLRDEQPDARNRRAVRSIEFVLDRLLEVYQRDTAVKWLHGFNAHLGDRRPIDVLAEGGVDEVLRAISAEEAGTYA